MEELQTDPIEKIGEGEVPEVPEGEEAVPEKDDAEGEQPRTDDGRYASPEDKSPEGQAEEAAPDETLEVREEADAGAAEKAEPTPYRYKSDHADYEVPGATVGADGVLSIPAHSVPHLTQLLASGRSYTDSRPRAEAAFQQQIKQVQAEAEAANQVRSALLDQLEKVAQMSPEAVIDWSEGFRSEWPAIRAKAEQAGVEASRQAEQAELAEYKRQAYERELAPQVGDELERLITLAGTNKTNPNVWDTKTDKGFLTREDNLAVYDRLINGWQTSGLVLNGDGSAWTGEQGSQKLNEALIQRETEYVAGIRRRQGVSTKQVTEAKKANKAEMSDSKAPPAVKAKTGPPAEGKSVKQFKPSKGGDPAEESLDYLMDMEVPEDL